MTFAAMQLKDQLGPIGDVQLVEMAVAGEKQAFISIMRRYNQLLFRTARSMNTVR